MFFQRRKSICRGEGLGVLAMVWMLAAISVTGSTKAARLFVDSGAVGNESGDSWQNAFADLQTALSSAVTGDEIWVACATYAPTERADELEPRSESFFFRAGVSVFGGFSGGEEVLNERDPEPLSNGCELGLAQTQKGAVDGLFHIVTIENVADPILIDGFSIAGGRATGDFPRGAGIRIANADVSLKRIQFDDLETASNTNAFGGAVFSQSAQLLLEDVVVSRCFSGRGGAIGMLGGQLTARGLTVSNCRSGFGGGAAIYLSNSAAGEITDSVFVDNAGANNGGAILNDSSAPLTIRRSLFRNNSARSSGGAMTQGGANRLIIENSIFVGNYLRSAGPGGAIAIGGATQATLTNNTIVGNEASTAGSGVIARGSAAVTVHNSILVGNLLRGSSSGAPDQVPQLEVEEGSAATLSVTYSILGGGFAGEGNLELDPAFVQTPNPGDGVWRTVEDNEFGDVRLTDNSPALDAGDNFAAIDSSGAVAGTAAEQKFDADLLPRLFDVATIPDTGIGGPPVIDMGAFEFSFTIFRDGFESR